MTTPEYIFKIPALHTAIATALGRIPFLSDVSILTEDQQDLQAEIEASLGTVTEKRQKIGIFCLVLTPRAGVAHPNAPGPILDPLSVVILVAEDVTINRYSDNGTKKQALQVVEILLRYHQRLVIEEASAALTVANPPFAVQQNDMGLLQYNVNFQTKLALKPEILV